LKGDFTIIGIGIALGLIYSIGLFFLFYRNNCPAGKLRASALLAAIIIIPPLLSLRDIYHFFSWDFNYLYWAETNSGGVTKMGVWLLFEAAVLLVFLLLGANRTRLIAAASFILSVIATELIPVHYFLAAVVCPLSGMKHLYEAANKFPLIYYIFVLFDNIIVTGCCFLASHWLRDIQEKPPFRLYSFFSSLFIIFSFIITIWWSGVRKSISISYLATALMGTLLLGVLIVLFYLYTRLVINANKADANNKVNDFTQYLSLLSKRELEVVEAILAGKNKYKELADKLNISVNTVKFHLKNIYKITGVKDISGIISLFRGYT